MKKYCLCCSNLHFKLQTQMYITQDALEMKKTRTLRYILFSLKISLSFSLRPIVKLCFNNVYLLLGIPHSFRHFIDGRLGERYKLPNKKSEHILEMVCL